MAIAMSVDQRVVIIAWKRLSRRTELLSKALHAKMLFFPDKLPYFRAAFLTIRAMAKIKPDAVIVQLPQGPLLLEALMLKLFYSYKLVADVHTGFLMKWEWKSLILNMPFKRLLNKCDVIVIHNEKMRELLPSDSKQKVLVVYDPWYMIKPIRTPSSSKEQYVVFPASYHPDEPLEEVLEAAKELCPNVKLVITGDWKKCPQLKRYASEQIRFTGFLSNNEYELLIANASGIISGTKEEYTALMSAWEAIAHAKPLAITKSQALEETYGCYPIYYDWRDKKSIAAAINHLLISSPNMAARNRLYAVALESLEKLWGLITPL
ncbi:MAG: glycosyltransferase [Candidatus Methanosuratincola sp.]